MCSFLPASAMPHLGQPSLNNPPCRICQAAATECAVSAALCDPGGQHHTKAASHTPIRVKDFRV